MSMFIITTRASAIKSITYIALCICLTRTHMSFGERRMSLYDLEMRYGFSSDRMAIVKSIGRLVECEREWKSERAKERVTIVCQDSQTIRTACCDRGCDEYSHVCMCAFIALSRWHKATTTTKKHIERENIRRVRNTHATLTIPKRNFSTEFFSLQKCGTCCGFFFCCSLCMLFCWRSLVFFLSFRLH